jgi:hypothetical protein
VWLAVDDHTLPDGELWLDLARRLPAPYDAAPLFLYGCSHSHGPQCHPPCALVASWSAVTDASVRTRLT